MTFGTYFSKSTKVFLLANLVMKVKVACSSETLNLELVRSFTYQCLSFYFPSDVVEFYGLNLNQFSWGLGLSFVRWFNRFIFSACKYRVSKYLVYFVWCRFDYSSLVEILSGNSSFKQKYIQINKIYSNTISSLEFVLE